MRQCQINTLLGLNPSSGTLKIFGSSLTAPIDFAVFLFRLVLSLNRILFDFPLPGRTLQYQQLNLQKERFLNHHDICQFFKLCGPDMVFSCSS